MSAPEPLAGGAPLATREERTATTPGDSSGSGICCRKSDRKKLRSEGELVVPWICSGRVGLDRGRRRRSGCRDHGFRGGTEMKVDYDPEARSLLLEFGEFHFHEEGDYTEELAGGTCLVRVHDGRPQAVQLLGADEGIKPLDEAAERFGLDAEALRAAASAALAAPDRG